MFTEENKRLVLYWKEEIWKKGNLDIVDELYAPDYVGHIVGTPGPVQGREALKQRITPTSPASTFTSNPSSSSPRADAGH